MKRILFIAVIVIFSRRLCGGQVNQDEDELVAVAVCFRHGDRAPISSYPNDPYVDPKYWPAGLGELVNEGKVNQFRSGKWLRSRYNGFLSENYIASELYVKSTDVDRTLASAASNLAGLYYPKNESDIHFWPQNLPWDPVPIHTVSVDDDEILAMKKKCKNFEDLYKATLHSEHLKNVLADHYDLIQIIEQNTDLNVTDLRVLQMLHSVFYIYKTENPSYLPSWSNDINQDELRYLAGLSFSIETFNPTLQRYKVGPFFNYLNNYFEGVLNGSYPKVLMLSGHDGTIASILNSYGSYDYHPPAFCSMIIWELYKTSNGDSYLKIFYKRNSRTESLENIEVGSCSSSCNYDLYKHFIQSITVDSDTWMQECNQKKSLDIR